MIDPKAAADLAARIGYAMAAPADVHPTITLDASQARLAAEALKLAGALSGAVVRDVLAERQRQIAKGYDAAHDDQHAKGEMITAGWGAMWRLRLAIYTGMTAERRDLLVQAAAQVVAEIERMDRKEPTR